MLPTKPENRSTQPQLRAALSGGPGQLSETKWSTSAPAAPHPAIPGPARSFNLALAVYQGSELSNLIPVAQSTSTNGLSGLAAFLRFDARAGQTYHLAVDSLTSDTGDLQLALNATLLPATLQLRFAGWEANGAVRLAVESSYLRNVLIQFSTNLLQWTTLQNVQAENTTTVNVSVSNLSSGNTFFRLKTLE